MLQKEHNNIFDGDCDGEEGDEKNDEDNSDDNNQYKEITEF